MPLADVEDAPEKPLSKKERMKRFMGGPKMYDACKEPRTEQESRAESPSNQRDPQKAKHFNKLMRCGQLDQD
jgi:hypothetical protein